MTENIVQQKFVSVKLFIKNVPFSLFGDGSKKVTPGCPSAVVMSWCSFDALASTGFFTGEIWQST